MTAQTRRRPAGHPARQARPRPARRRATVVVLRGELDIAESDALRSTLLRAVEGARHVVVDLTGVTLLDCVCLAVLAQLREQAVAAGSGLSLAAPSPLVRRVLRATAYDTVLPVLSSGTGVLR